MYKTWVEYGNSHRGHSIIVVSFQVEGAMRGVAEEITRPACRGDSVARPHRLAHRLWEKTTS